MNTLALELVWRGVGTVFGHRKARIGIRKASGVILPMQRFPRSFVIERKECI